MTYTESRTRTYFLSHDSQAPTRAQANAAEGYCTCLGFYGVYEGEDGLWHCDRCSQPIFSQ